MTRLLPLLILTLTLQGCASQERVAKLEQLPLPETEAGHCCWQVLQSLQINSDDQSISLQAALALTDNKLSMVIFDNLGRRLITLTNDNGQLKVDQSADISTDIPARLLMASAYLAYWPKNRWLDALKGSDWQLQQDQFEGHTPLSRTLSHSNKAVIILDNIQPQGPQINQAIRLQHQLIPLQVQIQTHQRQNL